MDLRRIRLSLTTFYRGSLEEISLTVAKLCANTNRLFIWRGWMWCGWKGNTKIVKLRWCSIQAGVLLPCETMKVSDDCITATLKTKTSTVNYLSGTRVNKNLETTARDFYNWQEFMTQRHLYAESNTLSKSTNNYTFIHFWNATKTRNVLQNVQSSIVYLQPKTSTTG